jgi:hypothetical protein
VIDKEMYIGWEVHGAVSDAQKPGQHWKLTLVLTVDKEITACGDTHQCIALLLYLNR